MSQGDFICDYCSRSFSRKYNLQTHIENCHVTALSYCEICDQKFGSPSGLQLHLSRGHNRYGQPFPECDICGRIFTRKQNVTSHMITVHLQGVGPKISCQTCEKTFTTERNLKRHNKVLHNPDLKYPTCDSCHKTFKTKDTLIAHIQAAHTNSDKVIKCHMCDKVYTNNRNLKRHIEMLHGEKEDHKCHICPKMYTSSQSLRRHIKTMHNSDEDSIQCEVKIESENIDWQSNECNDSIYSDMVTCETCNKLFVEESLLRQHVKNDHSFEVYYNYCKYYLEKLAGKDQSTESKLSVFRCEFCFSAYLNVYEFKEHMKVNHDTEYNLCTCNVCFSKFFSKEALFEHKTICLPPPNVNTCNHCDKLFTEILSLEFHTRIFHPQAQLADPNITSTKSDDVSDFSSFKCDHCNRIYYSDRSLKHHIKLKHTTDEAVECGYCNKICNNKYYLASHIKIVHSVVDLSKCDYCDKLFKSKRNIRRHIEYTHMGMQRYKCIECETLFKEKRSLRKHVRTKHPNSTSFPQCHICRKRFESAKSCKIHLKLLHSFNMNTYPCDLCSVSFGSKEALKIHLETKHLAEDEIYKCEECNLVFKGSTNFEEHNETTHAYVKDAIIPKQKALPRCVICIKDFSTRKTLRRHIKKFHEEFHAEDLATFGCTNREININCDDCLKNMNNEYYINLYKRVKHIKNSIIFKCKTCESSFNAIEFGIQRQKAASDGDKSKIILSDLCTTHMSDDEVSFSGFGSLHEYMEAESTTADIIKIEPQTDLIEPEDIDINIKMESDYSEMKMEPMSP